MAQLSTFGDDLGPAKVVHVGDREIGLDAVLVVDNVACGPSIGGAAHRAGRVRGGMLPDRPGDDAG